MSTTHTNSKHPISIKAFAQDAYLIGGLLILSVLIIITDLYNTIAVSF